MKRQQPRKLRKAQPAPPPVQCTYQFPPGFTEDRIRNLLRCEQSLVSNRAFDRITLLPEPTYSRMG